MRRVIQHSTDRLLLTVLCSTILALALLACGAGRAGAALTFVPTPANSSQLEGFVLTEQGNVWGVVGPTAISYLGVPFAAPPVGNQRWAVPAAAQPWTPKTLLANQFQAGCLQHCELPPATCPPVASEDCLYINIYTPRAWALKSPKPVMVFLPGGRFEQGANGTPLYDGTHIANYSQAITVIANYRLGVLGFMMSDAFPTGNYGFFDQRFVLQWVQRNIAAFGGDPTRVTLFGQSAGATSTTSHLISPPSWPYFHQAIIESNPVGLPLNDMATTKHYSKRFAEYVNCTFFNDQTKQRACLLAVTPAQVLKGQVFADNYVKPGAPIDAFYPWTPTIDMVNIPSDVWTAFAAGKFHRVPTMQGTVLQEGLMFVDSLFPSPTNYIEYRSSLDLIFHKNAGQVFKMYPATLTTNDTRVQMDHVSTDYLFTCPTRFVSNVFSQANLPVYLYQFTHAMSFNAWGPNFPFCAGQVCHGSELPFVFDSATIAGYQWGPGEAQLAEAMVFYWGNFAHTGSPNLGPNAVNITWPLFNNQTLQNIQLTVPITLNAKLIAPNCDYFDTIGYTQP